MGYLLQYSRFLGRLLPGFVFKSCSTELVIMLSECEG